MTVVDASVWVSRSIVSDANYAASSNWVAQHMAAGGLFVAPALVLSEVAGAIVRRTGDATFTQRVIQSLLNLPNLRLVPLDRQLGQLSAYLAIRLRLRGADAVYVATAQRLNLRHITWDNEQRTRTGGLIVARTP